MEGPMGDAGSVSDSSPLQIFVRAKKNINDIFVEIEDFVHDTVTCMQSVQQDGSNEKSDNAVQMEGYIDNVTGIRNVLSQDHMKVAFFGRTSNGKSSVINAMLHEKILPCGFGHTTNCFVQVEGSDSGESYLVIEGSTEKQNVKSVGQLAHALSEEKLGESQLVHIYWPKDQCLLLRDDVVFVDSPGFDMQSNFNEWIDRHCLDADVFVFVANAESTLMLAEKNFFHKVSTRLAKPNIFILNNHWDVVASEPDFLDQVRAQHMERAVEFLVEELKVCTRKKANQRIFFVSAKEALQARLQEQKGLPAHSGALTDGILNRYLEFQDFEQKFEECMSKSAVRTKFERHSQSGKLIVSEIWQIIDRMYDQAQELITQKAAAKKEIHDKLNFTKQQLLPIAQEMEDKIQQMVKDVEQRESNAYLLSALAIGTLGAGAVMLGAVMLGAVTERSKIVGVPEAVASYVRALLMDLPKKNSEANVRELKQQFTAVVTKQLQQTVDCYRTSADSSRQGEQEFSETSGSLCHIIDEATNAMEAEIKTLDEEIKQLEEAANSAEDLRNKANEITKQLEIFDDAFLKLHN